MHIKISREVGLSFELKLCWMFVFSVHLVCAPVVLVVGKYMLCILGLTGLF